MSAAKPTPGDRQTIIAQMISARYAGTVVATGECEANGRLIAAAPELLRALIDLGDWLAYGLNKADDAEPTAEDHAACERVAAQARAAIAKATGVA